MTTPILDHNRILMARLELNLSQRDVAFDVGINPVTMSRLEQGRSDESLDLRTVDRLAAALGLSITSLFAQPDAEGHPGMPTSDERRLEALLYDSRSALGADDIALTLGWTLPRAHAALKRLRAALALRGTMIYSSGRRHRVTARSDILTSKERQSAERTHHARLGLTVPEARLLQQVRRGTVRVGWTRSMSNKERVAAGSLFKAGLVEAVGERIQLTEDARFSLETAPARRPKGT